MLLVLVVLVRVSSAAKEFPVESSLLWEQDFRDVAPVDAKSGDSTDIVLVASGDSGYYVVAYDQHFQVVSASRLFPLGSIQGAAIGGKDRDNLWMTYVRSDSIYLLPLWRGYDRRLMARKKDQFRRSPHIDTLGGTLIASGTKHPRTGIWDGGAYGVRLEDINADGHLEALVPVVTGFARKPRGLFALDWDTGDSLWCFLMGPQPADLLTRDVDHDGQMELLLGSTASGNGNSDNGTDDTLSYVFCLNSNGTLRWSRQIGEYPQKASISWLNASDSNDMRLVVCEVGCPLPGAVPDSMLVLDARDGKIIARGQYGTLNQQYSVVRGNRGPLGIAVAGADDTLRFLNEKLELIRKVRLYADGCTQLVSRRFLGRAEEQMAILTTSSRLLMFDSNLRLLYDDRTGSFDQIVPLRWKNKYRLLLAKSAGNTPWQLRDFAFVPVWGRSILVPRIAVAAGFAVLLGLAVLLVFLRRQKQDLQAIVSGLAEPGGVIELDRKGRPVKVNQRAREILSVPPELPAKFITLPTSGPFVPLEELVRHVPKKRGDSKAREFIISVSPSQSFLARAVYSRSGSTFVTLMDATAEEYLRRVRRWIDAVQLVAHAFKTPLKSIQLLAEGLEVTGTGPGTKSIQEQAERLTRMTDNFLQLGRTDPPKREMRNLNVLLIGLMDDVRLSLKPDIHVDLSLDQNLPRVPVDEKQITMAIRNLVDNAVDAMRLGGSLRIVTKPGEDGNCVVLEVSDTGQGITDKDLPNIFTPFFTTKRSGTGLGLAIVKRVIEDHEGQVEVWSKFGEGTTFRVVLPTREHPLGSCQEVSHG